jgi:hypothetical protein
MHQRPFRPFVIFMSDGRIVEVWHPRAVAWDEGSKGAAVCALAGGGAAVIDLAQATGPLWREAEANGCKSCGGPAEGGGK